jgi:hypothetical protein
MMLRKREVAMMKVIIVGVIAAICIFTFKVRASSHPVKNSTGHIQLSSDMSLCHLMRNIELYQNNVVRVRAAILGMGGHYPFFVTASGCNPDEFIMLWVKFRDRKSTEAKLQKRINEILRFNLENGGRKAEAIIVGRIRKKACRGCSKPQLHILLMDIEPQIPELSDIECAA